MIFKKNTTWPPPCLHRPPPQPVSYPRPKINTAWLLWLSLRAVKAPLQIFFASCLIKSTWRLAITTSPLNSNHRSVNHKVCDQSRLLRHIIQIEFRFLSDFINHNTVIHRPVKLCPKISISNKTIDICNEAPSSVSFYLMRFYLPCVWRTRGSIHCRWV